MQQLKKLNFDFQSCTYEKAQFFYTKNPNNLIKSIVLYREQTNKQVNRQLLISCLNFSNFCYFKKY